MLDKIRGRADARGLLKQVKLLKFKRKIVQPQASFN